MDEVDPSIGLLKRGFCAAAGSPFPKREPMTTFSRTVIPGRA